MATVLKQSQSAIFPAAEVEACIREALANQAADQARVAPWPPPANRAVAILGA